MINFFIKYLINWQFSKIKHEHIYISILLLFYIIFFVQFILINLMFILNLINIPIISFCGIIIFTKLTFIIYTLFGARLLRFYFILKFFNNNNDQINYIKHELLIWVFVMLILDYSQIFICNFKISIIFITLILYNYKKFLIYTTYLKTIILEFINTKNKKLYSIVFSVIMVTSTKDHFDINNDQSIIPKYMLNKTNRYKINTPSVRKLNNDLELYNKKFNINKQNITKYYKLNSSDTIIKKNTIKQSIINYKPFTYSDNWQLSYNRSQNVFINEKPPKLNLNYIKSPLEISIEKKHTSFITQTIKDGVTARLPDTTNISLPKLTTKQLPLILAHTASTLYEQRANLFAPLNQKNKFPIYFKNTPYGLTIKQK